MPTVNGVQDWEDVASRVLPIHLLRKRLTLTSMARRPRRQAVRRLHTTRYNPAV